LKSKGYGDVVINDKDTTAWVIVDPSKAKEDTLLLQAAFNSGAKYVGLLNNESFYISNNIVVNRNKGKVELIYGYRSEIMGDKNLRLRENMEIPNNKCLFTIETGSAKSLIIKGIIMRLMIKRIIVE